MFGKIKEVKTEEINESKKGFQITVGSMRSIISKKAQ